VSKVEFYVQNVLKATSTVAPYEYQWDTKTVADGTYSIMTKAYDIIGNSSFDTRSVTVKNTVVQPPSAPINITARATQPTEVILNWQPGSAATGVKYRIVRNGSTIATIDGISYTDKAVLAGMQYAYHIIAVDANNVPSQLPSAPITVTTPALPSADTTAPTKPTNVTATAVGTTQVTVSWKASTDNVNVKEYDLYRSKGSASPIKIATLAGLNYGDSGLASDTEYAYYVIAKDAAGNASVASDTVRVMTATAPAPNQRPGVVRGTVKSASGRPLSGIRVTLWVGDKRFQATTNWRGQYMITKIPAGKYQVKIQRKAYDSKTYTIHVTAAKTKWLDITLRR
jgi:chitodextrinase